jgi:hypothetical protein
MKEVQYKELLAKSISFKRMSTTDQQKIASSTGTDQAKYAAIFQEEVRMLEKASLTFLAKNEVIVNQFKASVYKNKQSKLKNAEKKAETVDTDKAENLLKQI